MHTRWAHGVDMYMWQSDWGADWQKADNDLDHGSEVSPGNISTPGSPNSQKLSWKGKERIKKQGVN